MPFHKKIAQSYQQCLVKINRAPSLTKVLRNDLNRKQKHSYFQLAEQTYGNCSGHPRNEMSLVNKKFKLILDMHNTAALLSHKIIQSADKSVFLQDTKTAQVT